MDYQSFLAGKLAVQSDQGIEVSDPDINPMLFPFQRRLVQWALRKGRAALWADCGLGKTFMQLEWARLTGQRVLIVAPLAVAQQTVGEARKLGMVVQYARSQAQASDGITITNYEMVEHFNPSSFGAVVLDESSILKAHDGKTRTRLIEMFRDVPYRLCCTATPAPNDIAEFANHAEFLGICTRQEMLSMFFVHDEKGWRLKGHARGAFYRWMASWAMMLRSPADIGFSDEGYNLPPLSMTPVWLEGDADKAAAEMGQLFMLGLTGITGRSAVRKASVARKVEQAAEILNNSGEQWGVWCVLNEEGRQLAKLVDGAVLVEGKDSLEHKIDALTGFVEGQHRILISKPSIAGHGMNFQHCHNVMFLGITDSYESYYQAIRRFWRFGQECPVSVQVVLSDLEAPILENVRRKEAQAEEIQGEMVKVMSDYQKEELGISSYSRNGYHPVRAGGESYEMMLGDCVDRLKELAPESIDFSIFSPPFLSLYVYSDSERDMGNSRSEADFFQHYDFMAQELHRALKPGRNVAVHVAQVASTVAHDGYIGIKDFRGKVIEAMQTAGFHYHGDITVDKNPQAQAIRTHAKGLLFKQLRTDSSWLRPGLADYILLFRKPGENQVPIHPDISNEDWILWAHPVWYDIRETDTLNTVVARDNDDERHVCPLQLGLIERAIRLWTNPGETVLDPFTGIGSTGHEAIKLGRRFVGVELKPGYYHTALKNLSNAVTQTKQGKML